MFPLFPLNSSQAFYSKLSDLCLLLHLRRFVLPADLPYSSLGLDSNSVILFAAFVAPQLFNEFHGVGHLVVSVAVIFAAYVVFLLFLTSGQDPGIIHATLTLLTQKLNKIPPVCRRKSRRPYDTPSYQRRHHQQHCNQGQSTAILACFIGLKTTYENFRYRYDKKTNPYNLGCPQNVSEIFFSRIPNSKNNFRAKVKEESDAKDERGLELGVKRQTVAEEELEDIQSQIDSVRGSDRCSSHPPHCSSRDHKASWEITPDIEALAAELGMDHGYADRRKPRINDQQ
ncbi:hypothetical protein HPP92_025020 [Vanilla planifolia]|uniref:Uncharacterized protein n=1 Tax=Vanilla planifolia TaxID=51239 RepID=A0A835UBX2_VANPL|nr:hypothetical protein HPP92_025020 [Vanilla planifolia]